MARYSLFVLKVPLNTNQPYLRFIRFAYLGLSSLDFKMTPQVTHLMEYLYIRFLFYISLGFTPLAGGSCFTLCMFGELGFLSVFFPLIGVSGRLVIMLASHCHPSKL